jgi:transposase
VPLRRKNHLFVGSDWAAIREAVLCSLIEICKLNDSSPALSPEVLSRMIDGAPDQRLDQLLPCEKPEMLSRAERGAEPDR